MASKQIGKRQITERNEQDIRQLKRLKAAVQREAPNFSPFFWKSLRRPHLTPRALREHDRQNKSEIQTKGIGSGEWISGDLARFARRGGPNLVDLRGVRLTIRSASLFANPRKYSGATTDTMADTPASNSSQNRKPQSTRASSASARSRKSSAYDKNFQEHLINNNIYPVGFAYQDERSDIEPSNMESLQADLSAERASLSPSQFTPAKFREFKDKDNRATFEHEVMSAIIPIISGSSTIHSQQNVLFTELEPIATEDVVKPKPDLFDGAQLRDLNNILKKDESLRPIIVPSKHPSVPVAPNLFLEAKGPDGSASVAQRQACYDGAHGSKAMHALQNYRQNEPAYDGNAYTYSATYHSGTLKLYAHHVTAPTVTSIQPEYHMTQIDGWQMTGNISTFRRGATAFRNARDQARQFRDQFIRSANAPAQSPSGRSEDKTKATVHKDTIYNPHSIPTILTGKTSEDDALLDSSRNLEAEQETQPASQASTTLSVENASLSFASSEVSDLGTDPGRTKRSRQQSSPTSSWGRHSSKSRTRMSARYLASRESPPKQPTDGQGKTCEGSSICRC